MTVKDYLIACGIICGLSIGLTLIFMLLSMISWCLIASLFSFIFTPIIIWVVKFWKKYNCIDLEDFFDELQDYFKDKNNQDNNKIC